MHPLLTSVLFSSSHIPFFLATHCCRTHQYYEENAQRPLPFRSLFLRFALRLPQNRVHPVSTGCLIFRFSYHRVTLAEENPRSGEGAFETRRPLSSQESHEAMTPVRAPSLDGDQGQAAYDAVGECLRRAREGPPLFDDRHETAGREVIEFITMI